MDHRPENPAKTYLRRYRALVVQQESLQRSIDEAYERATSCTVKIKDVHVDGSGAYDRMAEDVARATDATAQLTEEKRKVEESLKEILEGINSVRDEMQKAVLLMRYVEGLDWIAIQEKIGYERTQANDIHGWALCNVKKWMIQKGLLQNSEH
jgi:seryl-tRNA synthetase